MQTQEQKMNRRHMVVPVVALVMVIVAGFAVSSRWGDNKFGRNDADLSKLKKLNLAGQDARNGVVPGVHVKAAVSIADASFALNNDPNKCFLVKWNPAGDLRGFNLLPSDAYPNFMSAAALLDSVGASVGSAYVFNKDAGATMRFHIEGNLIKIGNNVHTQMSQRCQVNFSPWMNVVFNNRQPAHPYHCQTFDRNPGTGAIVSYYSKAMPPFQSGAGWIPSGGGGYLMGFNENLQNSKNPPIDGPFYVKEAAEGVAVYSGAGGTQIATFYKAKTCNTIRYC